MHRLDVDRLVRLVEAGHALVSELDVDTVLDRLLEAAREAQRVLGRPLGSHTLVAGPVAWHDRG